ncbi:DMT family transporter [Aureimonas psammosilenae]|uniref:DMT family transporter n=1 Tax=Aureimonas psammosilenae TaxID=2495496 RepID=UPI00186A0B6D|nr:DMT family transporter [Aureimonas psammosilenae]
MVSLPLRNNTTHETRRGVTLMIVGSLIIPGLDASAKLLTEGYGLSTGEVALARFILQTVCALPLVLAFGGTAALRIRRPFLNLVRGMLLAAATLTFFTALKFMPLADATAIFFVEPILVTVLSAFVLHERIGFARIATVLCGFAGTLIVIRPNFVALGAVAVLPMLTALLVALYAILNRRLADTGKPLTMHLFSGLGGCIVLSPALAIGHVLDVPGFTVSMPSDPDVLGLFAIIAVVATIAHLMFIQAYHDAPASLLAPLGYIEIPSAVLLGLLVFGDFPDPITIVGIVVIVLSGLALVILERRPVPVPPPPQP